jgi:hypothetical protein
MGKQYEAIPPIDGDFKWENDRKKNTWIDHFVLQNN